MTTVPAYLSGFGNEFATEALEGALPVGRNSPQKCPYGLYAEQLSGTAFTAPRGANRRSWLYRIRPAAVHQPFQRLDNGRLTSDFSTPPAPPNQLRWDPLPMPSQATDFVQGIVTMAGNGDPHAQSGCGIHVYAANRSMSDRVFYNADAEMLIVPQQGRLRFATELGVLDVEPQEIVVIPRGVRFRVELHRRRGPRLRLRKLRRGVPAARPRRHRLQRPRQSARFPDARRLVRGPGRPPRAGGEIHGQPVDRRDGPFAARRRRLARQLRAVQVRSAPLQHHRLDQLRPSGSLDLPRAAGAVRGGRRRRHRLRHLPAARPGRAGHVPPAVVPSQHRVRSSWA